MPGLEFIADNSVLDMVCNPKFILGAVGSIILVAGAVYIGLERYRRIKKEEAEEARRRYYNLQE